MFTLKLTHGLSHDNGYVRATKNKPFVTVEDEAVARFCVDSGFFEVVNTKPQEPLTPYAEDTPPVEPATPTIPVGTPPTATGTPADDDDELEAMTVAELKAYAETTGVDLGKAAKKADIIAIIREEEAKA